MWLNRTASGVVGIFLLVIFIASCGSSDVQKAKEFMAAGMYPQAIELLNKRIQAKPDDGEAHFNLGVCLLNTGDFRGADERFASAVRLKPDFGFQIGGEFKKAADVAMQEGNTNKAIGLYANALKYQPDLKEPIGNALVEKGKSRRSLETMSKEWRYTDTLILFFHHWGRNLESFMGIRQPIQNN